VKIILALCVAVEVFLFCSVWYKLRKGKARIGGLSIMITASAGAACWTLSYLFQNTIRRDQIYIALGWLALNLWGYVSLSREDKEALDKQREDEIS